MNLAVLVSAKVVFQPDGAGPETEPSGQMLEVLISVPIQIYNHLATGVPSNTELAAAGALAGTAITNAMEANLATFVGWASGNP
jgi:hypothetical protein